MRRALSLLIAGVGTVIGLSASTPSEQAPTVADLLKRVGEYVEDYPARVSGVSLDEQFVLTELQATQIRGIKRIGTDLVLVNPSSGLMAIRDVYSIDTLATRPHEPRVIRLLAEPTVANWDRAQAHAQEFAQHFMADIVLRYSDPILALKFVMPEYQPKSTFKIEGQRKKNNVQLTSLGFKENRLKTGTYVLNTPSNAAGAGRFLIDPATGEVHQTELWVESDYEIARVTVSYLPHASLKLLLPREANHEYEARLRLESGSSMGIGGNRQVIQFESRATYDKATYTKVDLTRIAR